MPFRASSAWARASRRLAPWPPAAIDRTIEALKVCSAKVQRRGVSLIRSVATEACRRADNGLGFLERSRAETGIELEIITTSEEAKLAFSGCMPLLDRNLPFAIVFDIGGGSTELGWIQLEPGRIIRASSPGIRCRSASSPCRSISAPRRPRARIPRDLL